MNQQRFVLQTGDNLNLDYNLQVNGYDCHLRLTRLLVEKIDGNSCTVFIDSELHNDSVIKSMRAVINEGLIAYAEKKGGFISANEMRQYIDKMEFIRNLKGEQ